MLGLRVTEHSRWGFEFQFDQVGAEVERFKYLAPEEVAPFVRNDGLLDEFKLMYTVRHRFPLHYIVFKQTASHIPHEANVEQIFSRAGALSDPNMNPNKLSILVMVGINKKNYKPPVKDIKELYYSKFRGKGDSLDVPDEDDPALQ